MFYLNILKFPIKNKFKVLSETLFSNKLSIFFRKRVILSFILVGIGVKYYDDLTMIFLGEKYRMRKCDETLKERFNFSGKYKKDLTSINEICTIFPNNLYDSQILMELANQFKIPIIYDVNIDQNNINCLHIKVDSSNYDKIGKLDSLTKVISIEPGVKIFNLLTFLEKFNLTIPKLENYKFSKLSIGDILNNNFYSFNDGKFIDEIVKEVLVATPRKNRILSFKQNDDLTLTGLNMKNLFLFLRQALSDMYDNHKTVNICDSNQKYCISFPNPCCRYKKVRKVNPCGDFDCLF